MKSKVLIILLSLFILLVGFEVYKKIDFHKEKYENLDFPISEEKLLGTWTSSEVDLDVSLEFFKNSKDIIIIKSAYLENNAEIDFEKSNNNMLIFIDKKNNNQYSFKLYDDGLIMNRSDINTSTSNTPTAVRPWLLKIK